MNQIIRMKDLSGKRMELSEIFKRGFAMKWTGVYLIGYVILIGGVLAALWKMGVLASIGTAWTLIGVVIIIGVGIMLAVNSSGSKEKIEIGRK
jgi:hypothetical protein